MKDLSILPDNLPVPVDDGACDHLLGMSIPAVELASTGGEAVNFSDLRGVVVFYFFPMIGNPAALPLNDWNEIPGARGCTPQSCAFRDHYTEIKKYAANVFGVSAQPLGDQIEAKNRLHLPFALLNDGDFILADALRLPTFHYENKKLIKRLTLITVDGVIHKVFYPVFPPNKNAEEVLEWLGAQS
ncbi:MAG: peroxiredoxin [Spongiibacteraceae bacterium]